MSANIAELAAGARSRPNRAERPARGRAESLVTRLARGLWRYQARVRYNQGSLLGGDDECAGVSTGPAGRALSVSTRARSRALCRTSNRREQARPQLPPLLLALVHLGSRESRSSLAARPFACARTRLPCAAARIHSRPACHGTATTNPRASRVAHDCRAGASHFREKHSMQYLKRWQADARTHGARVLEPYNLVVATTQFCPSPIGERLQVSTSLQA